MKNLKTYLLLIFLFLTGCTGSILEEELLSNLSQKGAGGIELDEYIPPGIQFVENTSLGMQQDGFPYLRNNKTFNIKWIIKTCDPVNNPLDASCANLPTGTAENPDPGFYITRLEYTSGTTWVQIPGATDLGGYNDQVQSFSWSIPISLTDQGNQFKFKLVTRNAKLEEFYATSSNFIMDSTAPTIQVGSLSFNGSIDTPLNLKSPGVNIDFNADDNLSPIESFCLKDSAAIPTIDHSCWIKITSLGLTESINLQVRNLKRVLGWIGGSFSFYFWIKDKAGNMSRLTNDVGDETIDRRTISYAPGRSIVFLKNIAANDDTVGNNPDLEKTIIDATHPTMYIKWSYTIDQNTSLDLVEPYKIEYSTDALTFKNLTNASGTALLDSEISLAVNANCQTIASQDPASIDSCFAWDPPASLYNMPIYLRVHVRDSAGFVYSISTNPLNQNTSLSVDGKVQGLRFSAGLSDSLIGASALNTKFDIDTSYIRSGGKLVVHEDGRVFVLDNSYGIVEISQFDGKARLYIKKTGTSVDGYAVDTPSLLAGRTEATTSNILKISLDYKGRLIILENNRIRQVTDERDVQGNLTGVRQVKTIVGCTLSPTSLCYYDNIAKNTALNAKVPKQYWQNAWIYANEFNYPGPANDYHRMYRHFTPMPNGDIYFSVNAHPSYISTTVPTIANSNGLDYRVYRPDPDPTKPGKVLPLKLTGYGVLGEPFKPVSELYPSSMGGITFNPITGNPTTLTMFWQYCPPATSGQCEFFTSNHNPKTGQSNGTGTHYYSQSFSLKNTLVKGWSDAHLVKYLTSRRGELYAYNTNMYELNLTKLNTSTNKFEKILGTTYNGYCNDGTLATACPVYIRDAWVTQDNTVFFIDGQQIRMIGADGRVVTLFGRKPADRSGFEVSLSTLGRFENFAKWYDTNTSTEKFVLREYDSILLREYSADKKIETIAGDETTNWGLTWKASAAKPGYFVSTKLAKGELGAWNQAQYIQPPLIVDPANGEVFDFTPEGNRSVMKLVRSGHPNDVGRWLRILGGGSGATPFVNTKGTGSCDGKMNTQCRGDSNGANFILGYIPPKNITVNGNPAVRPAQIITQYSRAFSNIWQQNYLKLVNPDSGLQTHLVGNNDLASSWDVLHFPNTYSAVSIAATNNIDILYNAARMIYDANRDALLVTRYGGNTIGVISFKSNANEEITEADKYYNLTAIANGTILSFTHNLQEGADVLYFCNNSGRLYRRVVTPSFSSEIILPLPTGVTCYGRTLEKTVDTNTGMIKLFFPAAFKGQYMMGEYSVSLDL